MRVFPFELGLLDFNGTVQDDLEITLQSVREIFMKLTGSCPVLTENSFREEITLHYADFFEK